MEATPEEWEHGSSDIVYVLSHLVVSDYLRPHGLQPARLICPWGVSRQEYWSRLPCPPPEIFPTQGSNPGSQHCRWIFYQLSQQGSPRILEWVAYPFSRGTSWPRNQTRVSWIASGYQQFCHLFLIIYNSSHLFVFKEEWATQGLHYFFRVLDFYFLRQS